MLFYPKTHTETFLSVNISDLPSSLDEVLLPSNSSSPFLYPCFRSSDSIIVFSTLTFIYVLLILSFVMFFCYLGFHQERQQQPSMSHTDHFTLQCIVMQLIESFGFILYFCGGYTDHVLMANVGIIFVGVTSNGQALFHLCTCVERYLAVVHPITYLGLRPSTKVRIRNITIGCVWIMSCGKMMLSLVASSKTNFILYFCIVVFSLVVVSFCSISVLFTLKRPGPGEGAREQVDQSKLRAFRTIMIVMGILLFRFTGSMLFNLIYSATSVSPSNSCLAFMYQFWFSLPSTLMLPLLYLHRSRNLPCCK